MRENATLIQQFASEWLLGYRPGRIVWAEGISLFYLWYVLVVSRSRTWTAVRRNLVETGKTDVSSRHLKGRLQRTWRSMRRKYIGAPGPGSSE